MEIKSKWPTYCFQWLKERLAMEDLKGARRVVCTGIYLDRLSSLLTLSLISWLQVQSWTLKVSLCDITFPYFSYKCSNPSPSIYLYWTTYRYSILISQRYLKFIPYQNTLIFPHKKLILSIFLILFNTINCDSIKKLQSTSPHSSPLWHTSNWQLFLPRFYFQPLSFIPVVSGQ